MRRRGLFFCNRAGRRSAFLYGKEWLPGCSIEQIDISLFRSLRHGINRATFPLHRHERRRGRKIAVPDVVTNGLKVPDSLAGRRIQRNQGISKKIIAFSFAAKEIRYCRACRHIDDATFFVESETRPAVRSALVTLDRSFLWKRVRAVPDALVERVTEGLRLVLDL